MSCVALPLFWKKFKIYMRAWATKYELCNSYELNALIFSLNLALHNVNLNGKIHVANLNSKFFFIYEQHRKQILKNMTS